MKKIWKNAQIEEVDVKKTEFGPNTPEVPDSEKTQVTIDEKEGWRQLFGCSQEGDVL